MIIIILRVPFLGMEMKLMKYKDFPIITRQNKYVFFLHGQIVPVDCLINNEIPTIKNLEVSLNSKVKCQFETTH